MKIYMAPMEGITIYTYRNAYKDFFGHVDKYFTPFIAAEGSRKMKKREVKVSCRKIIREYRLCLR